MQQVASFGEVDEHLDYSNVIVKSVIATSLVRKGFKDKKPSKSYKWNFFFIVPMHIRLADW